MRLDMLLRALIIMAFCILVKLVVRQIILYQAERLSLRPKKVMFQEL